MLENVDHFHIWVATSPQKQTLTVKHNTESESGAFAKLRKRVFENPDLLARTKLLVYKAVILSAHKAGISKELWSPTI